MAETVFICSEDEKELWRFDGSILESVPSKRGKKGYCADVVPVDVIHSHTFKIPVTTTTEKIATIVEITMFEEGGLDLQKEYAITYVKHPLDFESSWLIEAFAVSHEQLHDIYDTPLKVAGHIDLLAVPYLVYESLYAYEKADKQSVELFLYLSDKASYAVLCKEGRYIAHRNLPSLESIALKAQVSVETLKETLRQRGLEKEKYGPDESLLVVAIQDAFANIVERVAQTVNHKRGIFGIGDVDAILIDFEQAKIPGLWELFDSYGFSESRKGTLACCEALSPPMQHRGVEALYLLAASQGEIEAPNLSIFEKRPGFLQTQTGKLIASVGVASLLTIVFGITEQMRLQGLETRESELQSQLLQMQEKSNRFRKSVLEERQKRDEVVKALKSTEQAIMAFDEAADAMMLIKASKAKRQAMMRDVVETMRKYRLLARSMEQNGSKSMEIDLLTSYAKRNNIAKFMKDLVEKGYGKVGTKAIRLDEDLYESRVEIVR